MSTHITFNGESGTIWRIIDVEFDKVTEDDEVRCLPKNAADLQWYLAINEPCLAGDDIYFAFEKNDKGRWRTYYTFDGWCREAPTVPGDRTLQQIAEMLCLWELREE